METGINQLYHDNPEFEEEHTTGWDMMKHLEQLQQALDDKLQNLISEGYATIHRNFGSRFAAHLSDYIQFSSTLEKNGKPMDLEKGQQLVRFSLKNNDKHEILTKLPMDTWDDQLIITEGTYFDFIYQKSAIIEKAPITDVSTNSMVIVLVANVNALHQSMPIVLDEFCPHGLLIEVGDKVFGYVNELDQFVIQEVWGSFTPRDEHLNKSQK